MRLRPSKRKQNGGADLAEQREPAAAHHGAVTSAGTNKRKRPTTVATDASRGSPITFTCLSSEIIQKIAHNLDFSDALAFARVCRATVCAIRPGMPRSIPSVTVSRTARTISPFSKAHVAINTPSTEYVCVRGCDSKGWPLSTPAMLAYRYKVRPRLCCRCYQMDVASLSTKLALGLVKPFSRQ